jgi:hypothetical protein
VGEDVWWESTRYKAYFDLFCSLNLKALKSPRSDVIQRELKPMVDLYVEAEFSKTAKMNYWSKHLRPLFVKMNKSIAGKKKIWKLTRFQLCVCH